MIIKFRQTTSDGSFRLENSVEIKEVMINEDLFHPDQESVALGFKNKDSSGIIELTPNELNKLVDALDKKKHLIKGIKIFKERVR